MADDTTAWCTKCRNVEKVTGEWKLYKEFNGRKVFTNTCAAGHSVYKIRKG